MIRYALHCSRGHEFEGWFGSSSDFDSQQERGLLECPVCGSHNVAKALMAPAVSGTYQSGESDNAIVPAEMPASGHQGGEPAMQPGVQLSGLSDKQKEILSQMRELKKRLLSEAENVGEKFSEEARKIHYGEAPARGIYGKASLDEAAELVDEGIDFLPLPDLPEDGN